MFCRRCRRVNVTRRVLHPGVVASLVSLLLSSSLVGQTRERVEPRGQERDRRETFRRYALDHPGSAPAGMRLFKNDPKLVCTNCHRITGQEMSGPNLDGIADKYSRSELIEHIFEPSRSIQPGYETVTTSARLYDARKSQESGGG